MNIFQAIILGIVEGLTEFLPVSSTAHLILTAKLLQIPSSALLSSFEIVIQLGAILAALILYIKKVFSNPKLIKAVIYTTIPTLVCGAFLYKIVKEVFLETFVVTIGGLLLGGLYLVIIEFLTDKKLPSIRQQEISMKKAGFIGINQAIAMIPGMSRAAMTISAGKLVGLSREEAVELSFLLAIPIMLAASSLDIFKSRSMLNLNDFHIIGIGLISAFMTAVMVMRWMVNFAKKHSLAIFGWYRIILAIGLIIFGL